MISGNEIVVTIYGHEKNIDKIAINVFDRPYTGQRKSSDIYCEAINNLKLNGDSWVYAKVVNENTPYLLSEFIPLSFRNVLERLDDISIQKVLREVDSHELVKALKGEPENILNIIFRNMSKRAVVMLKEDMEYTGAVSISEVQRCQEKIVYIVRHLIDTGIIKLISPGGFIE